MMLDYVDARYVMRVLDETVGQENWQRYHMIGDNGRIACGIGIRVNGEWVWKWDGAGETDIEAEKGAFSDSFKRAGVQWGIARDLYDRPTSTGSLPVTPVVRQSRPEPEFPPNEFDPEAEDEGKCPLHGWPFKNGKYGWFCSTKSKPGEPANKNGYCIQKPSDAWAARHEVDE
ncbi:MAG: hypothetical protein IT345_10775 [Trueperaceae bacterium]|nr:hypothetical protein [Trueperaceae bacterium]